MNNLATKLNKHHQLKHLVTTKKIIIKNNAVVQEWTSLSPFWAVQVEKTLFVDEYTITQITPPPILVPIVKGIPSKYNGDFEEVAHWLVALVIAVGDASK